MYDEIQEDEALLDAMERLQTRIRECRNEVLHCRLRLIEHAGAHNRRKLAEAKAAQEQAETEYQELLELNS